MEPTTTQQILYVAALAVFGLGCRTFENRFIAKLGSVALLGGLYLSGYFLTEGQHTGGVLFIGGWLLLPWMEIMFRVRRLRFPVKNTVSHRFPPSRDIFPDLGELTREAERAGFVLVGDAGWNWSETEHFMRLFYHEERCTQASVSLARQGEMGFSYVSITSRAKTGTVYTTTNYPFPSVMKQAPRHLVNRYENAVSFDDLLEEHDAFLKALVVETEELAPQDTEMLHAYIQRDLNVQVDHNLNEGLIVKSSEAEFRYSWRGCLYLYWQVLKDMVRV
jgi:hypothetical protein